MQKVMVILILSVMFTGCVSSGVTTQPAPTPTTESKTQNVSVVIDDGATIATFSARLNEGVTALAVLQAVGQQNGITVREHVYSFGTLVEAIGDKVNSGEKSWIYFVNGNSANVGASDYTVNPGDLIEWKYIKPIF